MCDWFSFLNDKDLLRHDCAAFTLPYTLPYTLPKCPWLTLKLSTSRPLPACRCWAMCG